jgi:hypothetical protein
MPPQRGQKLLHLASSNAYLQHLSQSTSQKQVTSPTITRHDSILTPTRGSIYNLRKTVQYDKLVPAPVWTSSKMELLSFMVHPVPTGLNTDNSMQTDTKVNDKEVAETPRVNTSSEHASFI